MSGISAIAIIFSHRVDEHGRSEICGRRGAGHRPPDRGESRSPGRPGALQSQSRAHPRGERRGDRRRAGWRRDDQGGLGHLCRGRPRHDLRASRRQVRRRRPSTRATGHWNFSRATSRSRSECALDLSDQPGNVTRLLNTPLQTGPGNRAQTGLVPDLQLRSHLRPRGKNRDHVFSAYA